MEIGSVSPITSTSGIGDAFARRELPLDTRRSDARARVQPDTFRPSLRTPLDADRILGARREVDDRADPTAAAASPTRASATGAATAPGTTESDTKEDGTNKGGTRDGSGTPKELSEDQKREVDRLERRDAQVRAHEQAHLSAAGGFARGGASFDYETGPDGKRYAVGGEVKVDMKTGRTPEETIRNAERVRAAALAPADPSSVDQQTAASAARMAQDARQELSKEKADAAKGGTGKDSPEPATQAPTERGEGKAKETAESPADEQREEDGASDRNGRADAPPAPSAPGLPAAEASSSKAHPSPATSAPNPPDAPPAVSSVSLEWSPRNDRGRG